MMPPAPYPPTKRQLDALRFVEGFLQAKGYCPSIREIMDGIGSKSGSRIFAILNGLEERGLIRRLYHRARSIEVLHPPLIPYDHHGRPVYFLRVG